MDFALFLNLKSDLRFDKNDIIQKFDKKWCERASYIGVNGIKSVGARLCLL